MYLFYLDWNYNSVQYKIVYIHMYRNIHVCMYVFKKVKYLLSQQHAVDFARVQSRKIFLENLLGWLLPFDPKVVMKWTLGIFALPGIWKKNKGCYSAFCISAGWAVDCDLKLALWIIVPRGQQKVLRLNPVSYRRCLL